MCPKKTVYLAQFTIYLSGFSQLPGALWQDAVVAIAGEPLFARLAPGIAVDPQLPAALWQDVHPVNTGELVVAWQVAGLAVD